MTKKDKIIYRISTAWLSLGMLSTGIVQVLMVQSEVALFTQLGYPVYFLVLLGVWKIIGVIGILLPRLPLVKEWAYAGFFFTMSGASISHITCGHAITELLPSLLLLTLTMISWYYRPQNKKLMIIKPVV